MSYVYELKSNELIQILIVYKEVYSDSTDVMKELSCKLNIQEEYRMKPVLMASSHSKINAVQRKHSNTK